jgi:aspartyl-tRNA(Asn)/glutamyl-tRNA(Gln) amidotransferase subunit A
VDRVAHALGADSELQFADAALARSAAFIISASEGGNQYLTDLRHSPERFEPHSRERLLAGAMIPPRGICRLSVFAVMPVRQ